MRRLLDPYRLGVSHHELLALTRKASHKGWWEAYSDLLTRDCADLIDLEEDARSCRYWRIDCLPGLPQIEEYAREINGWFLRIAAMPSAVMERWSRVRMLQRFLRRDFPLELAAALKESVLLRQVGDQGPGKVVHAV